MKPWERAARTLSGALGASKVLTGEEVLPFARDDSLGESLLPEIVVLAQSSMDVKTCLEVAYHEHIPVTPRAAGTGRSGGALPVQGGMVLSLSGMNQIKDISFRDQIAVVEPGVILGQLQEACLAEGLLYPPDPNSLASCMIGGNIGENAGGPRAFKYGSTSKWVLGLEACLMGGEKVFLGKRTLKGVTGYDLTSLFVGSEGTLGVCTEATLRLIPAPQKTVTLLGVFRSNEAAFLACETLLRQRIFPSCMEFMDSYTLEAMRAENVYVPKDAHALVLMDIETSEEGQGEMFEKIGNELLSLSGTVNVEVALREEERARLWKARRDLSYTTRKRAKYKLSEDVVVPRSQMASLLEHVAKISEMLGLSHLTYGHAGDGNLHVSFFWNEEEERMRVDEAVFRLMKETLKLGGTLSGEHGIGTMKAPYLSLEQSQEVIDLQQKIKQLFDPKKLLNPGKIFSGSSYHRAC